MTRFYISGAITGVPDYLIKFAHAKSRLMMHGYEVVNPAQLCLSLPQSFTHEQYMDICMAALKACDGIYLLKGWQSSKGAKIEAEYALFNSYTMIEEGGAGDFTFDHE